MFARLKYVLSVRLSYKIMPTALGLQASMYISVTSLRQILIRFLVLMLFS